SWFLSAAMALLKSATICFLTDASPASAAAASVSERTNETASHLRMGLPPEVVVLTQPRRHRLRRDCGECELRLFGLQQGKCVSERILDGCVDPRVRRLPEVLRQVAPRSDEPGDGVL